MKYTCSVNVTPLSAPVERTRVPGAHHSPPPMTAPSLVCPKTVNTKIKIDIYKKGPKSTQFDTLWGNHNSTM